MKKSTKAMLMLAMMLALVLAGCGSKEVTMKEFASSDGTVTISMDEKWQLEDMGVGSEGWVAAFTEDGSEGILVMQMSKELYGANIPDMDTWKSVIESSYPMSDLKEETNPSIPGMNIAGTYSCTVTADGVTGAGRVVYGETDYAYYSILYASPKLNDAKVTYFNNVCASFKETVQ